MRKIQETQPKRDYRVAREIHQQIAKKLLTTEKPAILKIREDEKIVEIKGTIRALGSGELWRSFQAENIDPSELTPGSKMTWAKMLVKNQVISRAFTANNGRTFTVEELDQKIEAGECDECATVLSAEIYELSGITVKEAEVTTNSETGQPLETFRPEQVSK